MFRISLTLLLVTPCFVLLLLTLYFLSPTPDPAIEEAEKRVGLLKKVTIKKALGPGTFQKVLGLLSVELRTQVETVWLSVPDELFQEEGVPGCVGATVYVPAQEGVELRTVLHEMLGPMRATWRVSEQGIVRIVPTRRWWSNLPERRLLDRLRGRPTGWGNRPHFSLFIGAEPPR
jgi:hypothetical protein